MAKVKFKTNSGETVKFSTSPSKSKRPLSSFAKFVQKNGRKAYAQHGKGAMKKMARDYKGR